MTDQYIGIDLHKAFFQACAVSPTGDRLWEGRFPRTAAGLEALTARCTHGTAVAVEAIRRRGTSPTASCTRSGICGSSIR